MKIIVELHGYYRELFGADEISLDLAADAPTVADIFDELAQREPELERRREMTRFAVNEEYAEPETVVEEMDEIAMFPPLAGGQDESDSVSWRGELTSEPIDARDLRMFVQHPAAGAVVEFSGVVRDHNEGRRVKRLQYEAHESMAASALREIARLVGEEFSVHRVAIAHRIGLLDIGDVAVMVLVSSSHRADGFDASRWAMEEIKREVPIFKKEQYQEGDSGWIGIDQCSSDAND